MANNQKSKKKETEQTKAASETEKKNATKNGGDNDNSSGEDEEIVKEQQNQQIIDSGIVATNAKHAIHCLTIIGQIEGHYILPPQNKTTKYEHIIPALVAIEQDKSIEGLLIILNTVGGDVEAGLAIAELISSMNKPTVSIVVGGGHSIGVPLAVCAKKSFIVPSATMTIHPVRMNGLVLGVPQTLSYFDRMQERITNFVTRNSNIPPERFKELMMKKDELVMDVGSVVDGETAVREGLISSLGGLSDAVSALYELIEEQNGEENDNARNTKKSSDNSAKSRSSDNTISAELTLKRGKSAKTIKTSATTNAGRKNVVKTKEDSEPPKKRGRTKKDAAASVADKICDENCLYEDGKFIPGGDV